MPFRSVCADRRLAELGYRWPTASLNNAQKEKDSSQPIIIFAFGKERGRFKQKRREHTMFIFTRVRVCVGREDGLHRRVYLTHVSTFFLLGHVRQSHEHVRREGIRFCPYVENLACLFLQSSIKGERERGRALVSILSRWYSARGTGDGNNKQPWVILVMTVVTLSTF